MIQDLLTSGITHHGGVKKRVMNAEIRACQLFQNVKMLATPLL